MTTTFRLQARTEHCSLAERLVSSPSRARSHFSWATALTYLLLTLGAVVMIVPFVWMVLTSLKPAPELVEFSFLPKNPTLGNYDSVLTTSDFGRWYFNSMLIAMVSTAQRRLL